MFYRLDTLTINYGLFNKHEKRKDTERYVRWGAILLSIIGDNWICNASVVKAKRLRFLAVHVAGLQKEWAPIHTLCQCTFQRPVYFPSTWWFIGGWSGKMWRAGRKWCDSSLLCSTWAKIEASMDFTGLRTLAVFPNITEWRVGWEKFGIFGYWRILWIKQSCGATLRVSSNENIFMCLVSYFFPMRFWTTTSLSLSRNCIISKCTSQLFFSPHEASTEHSNMESQPVLCLWNERAVQFVL